MPGAKCAGCARESGGHVFYNDELGTLVMQELDELRFIARKSVTLEDVFQAAYAAGAMARESARRRGNHTSNRVLKQCMRKEIYRAIRRGGRELLYGDLCQAA